MFKLGDTVEFIEHYSGPFTTGVRGAVTYISAKGVPNLVTVVTSHGEIKVFDKRLKLVCHAVKTDEELAKEAREGREKYVTAVSELQARGYVCKRDGLTLSVLMDPAQKLSIQKTTTVTTTKEL